MNTRNALEPRYRSRPALAVLPPPDPSARDDRDSSAPAGPDCDSARRIERCIHYMREHLNQPLQVATLAETAHTSPSHFFVLFKRWVGLSPIDYFIRLRMSHACRLLATTSLSVKEVAAALGYDDPFYFSRVFKSVNGTPPTDYRMHLETTEHSRGFGGSSPDHLAIPRLAAVPGRYWRPERQAVT